MALRIRDFNWRTDREAVLGFQKEVYELNFPGFRVDPGFLRDYSLQMRRAAAGWQEHMWVIDEDGRACGFLWASLTNTMVDECVGYIKNVYVAPHLRGLGWGKRLLTAADAWFASQGATKVALDASACNQSAVGLYLADGYEIVRHRMEKRLE